MLRTLFISIGLTCALASSSSATGDALAQTREYSASLAGGKGVSVGTGGLNAIAMPSPLFADLGFRTWSDEEPTLVYGGVLRFEVEGRASLGGVPRIELNRDLGMFDLRVFAGLPIFVAPFTMMGVEAGVGTRMSFMEGLGVFVTIMADAFVLGSDVPEDSTVLMFNGVLGVEFDL